MRPREGAVADHWRTPGEAGDCSPDGDVDLLDILGVLDAFQGASDCCPDGR